MQVLFVHGMCRTPISGLPMRLRVQGGGHSTSSFFYSVTFESFAQIESRLRKKIARVAEQGDYALVGHSLGGVLIRSALASLPAETRQPFRVFLMGSPINPSRAARYFSRYWLFRVVTRDCGQLLSSAERMSQIASCPVPSTSFVGTNGFNGRFRPFGDEVNDGIVSASEISAPWITEEVQVPVNHTWMPASQRISQLIIDRLPRSARNS